MLFRTKPQKFLVAVNDTPHSQAAFRWACRVARERRARLFAIHVVEVPLAYSLDTEVMEHWQKGEQVMREIELIGGEEKYRRPEIRCVRARRAGAAIVQEAEEREMDLVIAGESRRHGFGAEPMGVTTNYIFQHAPCQVLLWREPAANGERG